MIEQTITKIIGRLYFKISIAIKLEDQSDLICSSNALEHLNDDKKIFITPTFSIAITKTL